LFPDERVKARRRTRLYLFLAGLTGLTASYAGLSMFFALARP